MEVVQANMQGCWLGDKSRVHDRVHAVCFAQMKTVTVTAAEVAAETVNRTTVAMATLATGIIVIVTIVTGKGVANLLLARGVVVRGGISAIMQHLCQQAK